MNNKKLALILACAAMAGTSACNEVAEFCDGQSRCDNNVITICDGNKVVSVINCNDTNQVCDTATWTCVDQKPACTEGATQCSGTIIQTCTNGAWVNGTDCNTTNQICDSTANPVVCKNQEPGKVCEEGVKQCDGEVLQVCRDNAWTTDTDCATLDNKECKADGNGSFACVDKTPVACTTEGAKQCASNVLQVCEDGNWKDDTNCADNTDGNIVCGDNNGTAACVAPVGCDDKAHGDIRCKADSEADREICDNGTWKPTDACSGDTPVCIADNTDGAKCVVCKNDTYKDCTVEAVVDDYGYAEPKYNVKKCADNQWTDDVCPDDMICNADGTACVDKTEVLACGSDSSACVTVGSTEYYVMCASSGAIYEQACLNNTVCDLDTQSCAKVSCADDAACNESKLASITCGDNPAYDGKASYFKKDYVDTDNDGIIDGLACTADCTFDYDTYCYTCDDTRECDPNEDYTCEDIDSSKTWKEGGVPVCDGCLLTQGTCEEDSGVEPPTDGGLFISEVVFSGEDKIIELYNNSSSSITFPGEYTFTNANGASISLGTGTVEKGSAYVLCSGNLDGITCDATFNTSAVGKKQTLTLKKGDDIVDVYVGGGRSAKDHIRLCGISKGISDAADFSIDDWKVTEISAVSEIVANIGTHNAVCADCSEPEVSDGIGGCMAAPSCEGDGVIEDPENPGTCICDASNGYSGEAPDNCLICGGMEGAVYSDYYSSCICDWDHNYYDADTNIEDDIINCQKCPDHSLPTNGSGGVEICMCDTLNEWYGSDPTACVECKADDHKVWSGTACVCDTENDYVDDGEGGCKKDDTPECTSDNYTTVCTATEGGKLVASCPSGSCVYACDTTNGWYGSDPTACVECKADDHNVWKDNACVCDNASNYYGLAGSCQLCSGENKVVKENACVCDEGYHDVDGACVADCTVDAFVECKDGKKVVYTTTTCETEEVACEGTAECNASASSTNYCSASSLATCAVIDDGTPVEVGAWGCKDENTYAKCVSDNNYSTAEDDIKTCAFGCRADGCVKAEGTNSYACIDDNTLASISDDRTNYSSIEVCSELDSTAPNCGVLEDGNAFCYECVTDAHCASKGTGYTCIKTEAESAANNNADIGSCALTAPKTCEGVGIDGVSSVDVAHEAIGCTNDGKEFACNNGEPTMVEACGANEICKPGEGCVDGCRVASDCGSSDDFYGHVVLCTDYECDVDETQCDTENGYHMIDGSCQLCPDGTVYNTTSSSCESITCSLLSIADNVAYAKYSKALDVQSSRVACGNDSMLVSIWQSIDAEHDADNDDIANYQYKADLTSLFNGSYKCAYEVKVGDDWYACDNVDAGWSAANVVKITNTTESSAIKSLAYTREGGVDCVAGATKCETNNLYTCSDAGAWVAEDPACANGCGEDPDKEGAYKCLDAKTLNFSKNSAYTSCDALKEANEEVKSCECDSELKNCTIAFKNGIQMKFVSNAAFGKNRLASFNDDTQYLELTNLDPGSSVTYNVAKPGTKTVVELNDKVQEAYSKEFTAAGSDTFTIANTANSIRFTRGTGAVNAPNINSIIIAIP